MVRLNPRWLIVSIALVIGVVMAGCTPGGGESDPGQPASQAPVSDPAGGIPGY